MMVATGYRGHFEDVLIGQIWDDLSIKIIKCSKNSKSLGKKIGILETLPVIHVFIQIGEERVQAPTGKCKGNADTGKLWFYHYHSKVHFSQESQVDVKSRVEVLMKSWVFARS